MSCTDGDGVSGGGIHGRFSCVVLGGVWVRDSAADCGAVACDATRYIEDQHRLHDGEWVDRVGIWGAGDCGHAVVKTGLKKKFGRTLRKV